MGFELLDLPKLLKMIIDVRVFQNTCSLRHFFSDLQCYRNDPKFSDRKVLANSADPDQTAPRGAV